MCEWRSGQQFSALRLKDFIAIVEFKGGMAMAKRPIIQSDSEGSDEAEKVE